MKLIKIVLLLALLIPTLSFADRANREVTVRKLHPIAEVRPGAGGLNLIRIYVNQASWGELDCRDDAADLKKSDDHLLSILLWAMSMDKKIKIEVTEDIKPYDTVCQVTALHVVN